MASPPPLTGTLFKGNIFGGSNDNKVPPRRPSTSQGPSSHSPEYTFNSATSARKTSSTVPTRDSHQRSRSSSVAHSSHSTHVHTDNHKPPALPGPIPRDPVPRTANKSISAGLSLLEAIQSSPPGGSPRKESVTSITPSTNMLARSGNPPSVSPVFALQSTPTFESIAYQHIQDISSKRISTLDYLRKSHEGSTYFFNTLLFQKSDLQRMPYFEPRRLARRATNLLLLGISLPTVLDLNGSTPLEFLKTLNSLLSEFESFQQAHPADISTSSLSRGRFPQMFKRATGTGKGRRQSTAAEIGLPMNNDNLDSKPTNGSVSAGGGNGATAFSLGETDLLPGEEYTLLLTPSLPFDPDFYETFATLCDVLIDCYTKIMGLVSNLKECSPIVAEMFTKADARVRKIIVNGVVKEFEESSRSGVRNEVAGVGRVVLGGLM